MDHIYKMNPAQFVLNSEALSTFDIHVCLPLIQFLIMFINKQLAYFILLNPAYNVRHIVKLLKYVNNKRLLMLVNYWLHYNSFLIIG